MHVYPMIPIPYISDLPDLTPRKRDTKKLPPQTKVWENYGFISSFQTFWKVLSFRELTSYTELILSLISRMDLDFALKIQITFNDFPGCFGRCPGVS